MSWQPERRRRRVRRWHAALALTAVPLLVLAGYSQTQGGFLGDGGRTFAFEVTNGGTVAAVGVANATADGQTASMPFRVPARDTARFHLDPPGDVFGFHLHVQPEGGGARAGVNDRIDLTACPHLTVYAVRVESFAGPVSASTGESRCEG